MLKLLHEKEKSNKEQKLLQRPEFDEPRWKRGIRNIWFTQMCDMVDSDGKIGTYARYSTEVNEWESLICVDVTQQE